MEWNGDDGSLREMLSDCVNRLCSEFARRMVLRGSLLVGVVTCTSLGGMGGDSSSAIVMSGCDDDIDPVLLRAMPCLSKLVSIS